MVCSVLFPVYLLLAFFFFCCFILFGFVVAVVVFVCLFVFLNRWYLQMQQKFLFLSFSCQLVGQYVHKSAKLWVECGGTFAVFQTNGLTTVECVTDSLPVNTGRRGRGGT